MDSNLPPTSRVHSLVGHCFHPWSKKSHHIQVQHEGPGVAQRRVSSWQNLLRNAITTPVIPTLHSRASGEVSTEAQSGGEDAERREVRSSRTDEFVTMTSAKAFSPRSATTSLARRVLHQSARTPPAPSLSSTTPRFLTKVSVAVIGVASRGGTVEGARGTSPSRRQTTSTDHQPRCNSQLISNHRTHHTNERRQN